MPRAVVCRAFGPPEELRLEEIARAPLAAGQVRVALRAAGINFPDILMVAGQYQLKPPLPFTPGVEAAGEVTEVAGAGGIKVGDKVMVKARFGCYAEEIVAAPEQLAPLPPNFDFAQGATFLAAHGTAYHALVERARIAPGETLLVHGGASGIGTTAIALARAFGHTVYATAGGPARARAVEALGCARGIDYRAQDFVAEIKALTGGRGVDVILDMVAGDYLERNIEALADDGRLVMIALLGGSRGTLNCGQVMRRRLTVTGSTLRAHPVAFKARIAAALRERVWPLLESGAVRPSIHATFPLAEAARAHAMMDAGEQIGKIVLAVR